MHDPKSVPGKWDLDAATCLASRKHLLARFTGQHAQWEHQLAVLRRDWCIVAHQSEEAGQQHWVVTPTFLDAHLRILRSLVADMTRLVRT